MPSRLFTARFFVMCAYSFTVFVSVFQLLPTAPYHVIDLGGSTTAAGLFLGCLTYSSAFSAPLTGAIGDRFGQRRVLMIVSLMSAVFSVGYALIANIPFLLTVVVLHGLFWSALLSASGAYMTATIPESRRAEGISYWGLASTLALATAPTIGFWVYRHGWRALCAELVTLNLIMALIAWRLPEDRHESSQTARGDLGGEALAGMSERAGASEPPERRGAQGAPHATAQGGLGGEAPQSRVVDWRVLVLSITMALVSFGYGALTSFSALFADELHVTPRALFLAVMASAIVVVRLTFGRGLDRFGHRRVLIGCLAGPAVGLLLLAAVGGKASLLVAALVFGLGFGLMYPSYTAYVLRHVLFSRRGAAFGAMLAAFDTGVGSGSSIAGWIIHRFGFRHAFAFSAVLAVLALPYFLLAERTLGFYDRESA
jgi:MFS family permease